MSSVRSVGKPTLFTTMPPRLCATNMIGRSIDYSCQLVPRRAPTAKDVSYVGYLPLPAQVGYEIARMVVKVLAADARARVGVGIVAPAENAGAREVGGQEVAEPVDAIVRGPCLVSVAVEAMHSDDATEERSQRAVGPGGGGRNSPGVADGSGDDLLNYRVMALCDDL